MPTDRPSLDEQFRTFLKRHRGNVPAREMAAKLNVSRGTYIKFEDGPSSCALRTVERLLSDLGMDVELVITSRDKKSSKKKR